MKTWVTIAVAAKRSGLHATTIWRWTRQRDDGWPPHLASKVRRSSEGFGRWVWLVPWEAVAKLVGTPSARPQKTGRPKQDKPPDTCRAARCDREVNTKTGGGKGLCNRHYQQQRRRKKKRAN